MLRIILFDNQDFAYFIIKLIRLIRHITLINVAFHRFKDMDLVEQIHIFGLSNILTFETNISLIGLFRLIFNNAKPQMMRIIIFNVP